MVIMTHGAEIWGTKSTHTPTTKTTKTHPKAPTQTKQQKTILPD